MTKLEVVRQPRHYTLHFAPPAGVHESRGMVTINGSLTHQYHVCFEGIERVFGIPLSARNADLAELAISAYVGDRVSPRRSPYEYDPYRMQWRRHLHLRIPLRDANFWNQPEVSYKLCALLEHYTDDAWSFEFLQRAIVSGPVKQEYLPLLPDNLTVMPFSGGLDSLAGAVDILASKPGSTLALCSVGTNPRTTGRQRALIRDLTARFGHRITPAEVPVYLIGSDDGVIETTQRSRGFVFLVLAALVAELGRLDELMVAENGIGALALPYNYTQVGTHTTRAVHPLSLIRLSEFVTTVFGHPFRMHNPYLFQTKGQMCTQLAGHGASELAASSVSCDTFGAHRDSRAPQCGVCTSCLLRRQALYTAGLKDVEAQSGYRYDVLSSAPALKVDQLYALHAMRDQVGQIRTCLQVPQVWSGLAVRFPDLEEVRHAVAAFEQRDSAAVAAQLVDLYRSYVDEWDSFPAGEKTQMRAG